MQYFTIDTNEYFDIINLDRYDIVIGTVPMRKYGISLDFGRNIITIQGKTAPMISEGEERTVMARRYAMNRKTPKTDPRT